MKKIIDGKMYDTSASDVIYINEMYGRKLFRTKNGNFFMFYPTGEIVPKTEDEAKEFLGLYDTDIYISLWGEVEEA